MTMLRAGGLLNVLTPLSDCRQESVQRWIGDFGGFVYVLDRFPQRDLGLWIFMCPINFSVCLFSLPCGVMIYKHTPCLLRTPTCKNFLLDGLTRNLLDQHIPDTQRPRYIFSPKDCSQLIHISVWVSHRNFITVVRTLR